MALSELITCCKRLIVGLEEIKVIKPLAKTLQLLLDSLFTFAVARKIEVPIALLQTQAYFFEIAGIIILVLLQIFIQVSAGGVGTIDREELPSAQSFIYTLSVISHNR